MGPALQRGALGNLRSEHSLAGPTVDHAISPAYPYFVRGRLLPTAPAPHQRIPTAEIHPCSFSHFRLPTNGRNVMANRDAQADRENPGGWNR